MVFVVAVVQVFFSHDTRVGRSFTAIFQSFVCFFKFCTAMFHGFVCLFSFNGTEFGKFFIASF